jgi:tripartite-type tricarboxylate transporter receptor subunit TctC
MIRSLFRLLSGGPRRRLPAALLLAVPAFFLMVGGASAQDYPVRPIKLVVPYPPGGSSDFMARMIAQKMSATFKESVVVENRPGASAMIGSEFVARSKADGYTLLFTGGGPHAINVSLFPRIPYDPLKDFDSIGLAMVISLLMTAPANAPYANAQEFIAWAQRNRGKVNYCSIGSGSPSHLAAEMFASAAGIEMTHLPYKGSAPAIVDTIGGVCHVMFDSALSSGPHVKSGKLRALGIASRTRLSAWPEVPTIAESGLPGYEAATWGCVLAPAGTPRAIVNRLNQELNQLLALPDVRAALEKQGASPGGGSPQDLTAFTEAEIRKWGKVIRDGNIKPD